MSDSQIRYQELLKDPRWKHTRERIIARDGECCRVCGARNHLEVHHSRYEHFEPWRTADHFLVTLCRRHHSPDFRVNFDTERGFREGYRHYVAMREPYRLFRRRDAYFPHMIDMPVVGDADRELLGCSRFLLRSLGGDPEAFQVIWLGMEGEENALCTADYLTACLTATDEAPKFDLDHWER